MRTSKPCQIKIDRFTHHVPCACFLDGQINCWLIFVGKSDMLLWYILMFNNRTVMINYRNLLINPNWIHSELPRFQLSNTSRNSTTTHVLTFIIHAEFNCVNCVLLWWVNMIIPSITNNNFIQFISSWGSLDLGNTNIAGFLFLRASQCASYCNVTCAIVAALWCHRTIA